MGFSLKSITKGLTKAADVAFNPSTWVSTAKDMFSGDNGGLMKMGAEALGTYFGMPGLGSAIGGFLGGDGDLSSILKGGIADYSAKQVYKQQQQQVDDIYSKNIDLANMQNRQQMSMLDESNKMGVQNAREQMAFQTNMANTAHQREVSDLRAAGLNPILSGTGGMGNATPSGASYSPSTPSAAPMSNALTSAFEAFRSFADSQKINAVTNLTKSQTATEQERPANVRMDTDLKRTQDKATATVQQLNIAQKAKVKQETINLVQTLSNSKATEAQTKQATENLKQVFRTLRIEGDISEADATYWSRIIGGSAGAAKGSIEALKALLNVLK